ncbi:Holliday junction resolvase RuvX [Thermosipho globiformans]|uniref:Holliday junction resolvase RuvX n=1 Tax=Thermosipho globiformans TaxID=380685 RepID=UPI000F8D189E|nr:Holliday junction resolvase RuvX [Thermosipho globiformans]
MIIAIDYGNSKCGYAIGNNFISKSGTVKTKDIMKFILNTQSQKIILGIPLSMSGNYSTQSLKVLTFANKLLEKGYDVFLIDERLTTKMASSFGIKDDDAFSARQIFMDFAQNPSVAQKFRKEKFLNLNLKEENVLFYEVPPSKKVKGDALTKDYSIAFLHLSIGNFTYSNPDTLDKKYNIVITKKEFEKTGKNFLKSGGKIILV